LHGNGGNGNGMVAQHINVLGCHVLVAPTGYENSWNICGEKSDAPDMEMVNDLVNLLQGYENVNPNQIRILGSSNGAGLANRAFIESTNPGIDLVCAVVSHLNEPQYHSGGFHKPSSSTDSSAPHCGYDVLTNPLTTRKYLSISNTNDQIIPYEGGTSVVGVDFLPAEEAAYIIAQNQGYTGSQLESGTPIGNPEIFEFSYLSGKVVHIKGDAAHGRNATQSDYIKSFFSDCAITVGLEDSQLEEIKVYPNPIHSLIRIERVSSKAMPYSIFNTLGQEVLIGISTSKTMQIDLSELPANVYFLKADSRVVKMIKQ
ncbi:MAG: T9SS type A sorting domain-containing protein, partial [Chitinophagales bacterium]